MTTGQRPAVGAGVGKRQVLAYGDATRVIGACCVMLIHTTSPADNWSPAGVWCAIALNVAARWCVPAFLLLSGALLLDPTRIESAADFYRRRLWRVGVPVAVWSALYVLHRTVVLGEPLQPTSLARDFVRGEPMYHLWFAYVLIGLYLVTPLIRWLVLPAPRRAQWTVAWVALLTISATQLVGPWISPPGSSPVTILWVSYVGYFLLGPLVAGGVRGRTLWWAVSFVATVVVCTVGRHWAERSGRPWVSASLFAGYLSPLAVAMCLTGFVTVSRLMDRPAAGRPPVPALAAASFGAYLAHVAVMDLLLTAGWEARFGRTLSAQLGLWAAVVALSFALAAVLLRTPVLCYTVGGGRR